MKLLGLGDLVTLNSSTVGTVVKISRHGVLFDCGDIDLFIPLSEVEKMF